MNYNFDDSILENSYSQFSKLITIKYEFNLYKLIALKNLIFYIFDIQKVWNYTLSDKKQYSRHIIDDLNVIRIYNEYSLKYNDVRDFCIHICFNCKQFNELTIQTFFSRKKQYNSIDDEIELLNNYYADVLNRLCLMVKNAKVVDNYFYECFQIKSGDLCGYYKFDNLELDCGEKTNSYIVPRVIKAKIKYHKILINELMNLLPENNTLFIDRKIMLVLVQTFTRTYFEDTITNGKYYGLSKNSFYDFNIEFMGDYITLDRSKSITEHYEAIPDDTNLLINKFYNLSYEKQNVFLSACEMYVSGIKDYSSNSFSMFVFALESLANYEYKTKMSGKVYKKQRIYNLIMNLYGGELYSYDFISYIYDLRNMFSHEAISNNRLKHNIFEFYDVDKNLILIVEALVYSVLVKWIERE